jgi:hypothetical protein
MAGPGGAPGEGSPSFAQTGAEFTLDDSDIDDLDLHSEVGGSGGGGGGEAYEMLDRSSPMRNGPSGSDEVHRTRLWDADEPHHETRDRGRGSVSASSVASFELYTPDEELAVRRKFDRKLVLFVALLYMLSFLDRSSLSLLLLLLLLLHLSS